MSEFKTIEHLPFEQQVLILGKLTRLIIKSFGDRVAMSFDDVRDFNAYVKAHTGEDVLGLDLIGEFLRGIRHE